MSISQMELSMDLGLMPMTNDFTKAIKALRDGKVILLLDAHDRENEGDLIVAAEKITTSSMNFLIKKGSGVVCLAMPKKRLDELGLPLMSSDNTNFFQTAFTVSIEASRGVTTGVSAKDRAHTIQTAMADDVTVNDLARPGHVFPLAARRNGIFDRMGHTEGSVDLMRIAGLKPGAVLCELMNEDGSMTTGEDRKIFAAAFDIPVMSVEEILFYRMQTEDVCKKTITNLSTRFGEIVWANFTFLDAIVVDVFYQSNWSIASDTSTRVSFASGYNLKNRFMAQILNPSEDDPLIYALTNLHDDKCDVAVMCTSKENAAPKTDYEIKVRENAAICRVLQELGIKKLSSSSCSLELSRIASHYFAIAQG